MSGIIGAYKSNQTTKTHVPHTGAKDSLTMLDAFDGACNESARRVAFVAIWAN